MYPLPLSNFIPVQGLTDHVSSEKTIFICLKGYLAPKKIGCCYLTPSSKMFVMENVYLK